MLGVVLCQTPRHAFWYLWVAYFSLYLCRLNLSAALPAMLRAEGFTVAQGGWIGSGFFACYAIGQVVNGFSSDRFGPRRMLALGLLGSAVVNILFSFSQGIEWLVALWALNGFFQSMGWPACVRAMADWFPLGKRGRLFGLFATSYHAGNISALLLSGWICATIHWRHAFLIPSIPLFVVGLLFYLGFRNRPAEASSEGSQEVVKRAAAPAPTDLRALFSWRLLLVGLSVSAMSVVGYGFLFWAPTYLAESRNL
ncbi:MAG TPA: MFS transporter, partial [Armatimonadota bacterium]|nr:MFS transporter [Armatimonadota bacterium]